jgi:hypothetical protein
VKPPKVAAPEEFSNGYKEYRIFKHQFTAFVNAHDPNKGREFFQLKSLLTGKKSKFAETIDFTKIEKEEKSDTLLRELRKRFNDPIIQVRTLRRIQELKLTNSMDE